MTSLSSARFGRKPSGIASPPQNGSTYLRCSCCRHMGTTCGSNQRLPPAHLRRGFSDSIVDTDLGAGGETRTLMRSEPRQILSLVRIPISPLRLFAGPFLRCHAILETRKLNVNLTAIFSRCLSSYVDGTRCKDYGLKKFARKRKNLLAIGNTLLYNA